MSLPLAAALSTPPGPRPLPPPEGRAAEIWAAVDRLVDRAPSLADLRSHKLELFAAQRWRSQGRQVPEELLEQERRAAVGVLAAPVLLQRVRAAVEGDLVLLKGPDVAKRYPDPALRAFSDIDLLVADAPRVQRALLHAGFEEVGDPSLYLDIHHLRPLRWRDLPLVVEIHSRPKWIEGGPGGRTTAELIAAAEPGPSGYSVLPPAHHAVLLAAHSWAHEPLRRLRDLIDVAVMAEAAGRANVERVARAWGQERLWRVTIAAADAVLLGADRPWALRLWAQNLANARERTVLENHLQRWLSDFSVLSPGSALARIPGTVAGEFRPDDDESWGSKLSRSLRALRNASQRRSTHDEELSRRKR